MLLERPAVRSKRIVDARRVAGGAIPPATAALELANRRCNSVSTSAKQTGGTLHVRPAAVCFQYCRSRLGILGVRHAIPIAAPPASFPCSFALRGAAAVSVFSRSDGPRPSKRSRLDTIQEGLRSLRRRANLAAVDGFGPFPRSRGVHQRRQFSSPALYPVLKKWLDLPFRSRNITRQAGCRADAITPELRPRAKPKTTAALAFGAWRNTPQASCGRIPSSRDRRWPKSSAISTGAESRRERGAVNVYLAISCWKRSVSRWTVRHSADHPAETIGRHEGSAVLAFAHEGRPAFCQSRAGGSRSSSIEAPRSVSPTSRHRGAYNAERGAARRDGHGSQRDDVGNTLAGSAAEGRAYDFGYLSAPADIDRSKIVLWGDSFGPAIPVTCCLTRVRINLADPRSRRRSRSARSSPC